MPAPFSQALSRRGASLAPVWVGLLIGFSATPAARPAGTQQVAPVRRGRRANWSAATCSASAGTRSSLTYPMRRLRLPLPSTRWCWYSLLPRCSRFHVTGRASAHPWPASSSRPVTSSRTSGRSANTQTTGPSCSRTLHLGADTSDESLQYGDSEAPRLYRALSCDRAKTAAQRGRWAKQKEASRGRNISRLQSVAFGLGADR